MRNLLLIPSACLWIAACGSTNGDAPSPAPPSSLLVPCAQPVWIPGALDDQQIELMWGEDRVALRRCGVQLDALVATFSFAS